MTNTHKYGSSWKRKRDKYIAKHKNCELCLMHMDVSKATEVHHIVPVSRGGTNDDVNLMALCHSCHEWIHKREQKGDKR